MRIKLGLYLLTAALAIGLAGTAIAVHEGQEDVPKRWVEPAGWPGADAQAVWTYITQTKPYTKWPRWPGKGKFYAGRHPHGALLTTYVSKDAGKVIKKKQGAFANGAFIVKENYTADKTLAAVTVMYKIDGYNPEAGDWFWAKYKADGSVEAGGKVEGCINCHRDRADHDWVFTGDIK